MLLLLLDYLPRHYSRLLPCHKTNMSHSIGKRRLERRLDIPCWQNILMLASRSNTTLNAAVDEPGDSFPITEYVIHSIVVGMEKFTATSTTTTCSSHISHTFLSHLDDSLFTRFFLLLAHWVGKSKNSAKIERRLLLQLDILLHLSKKPDNNDAIIANAENHLTWIKEVILSREEEPTDFTNHIVKSVNLFCSNMVTLNICNVTMADLAVQTSSDFLQQGIETK